MPRRCHFTGVGTRVGNSLRYRGRPKYLGGIGLKMTSCTRRTFKPNLQDTRAMIDGKPEWIQVSAKSIRNGLVVKPLRRKFGYTRARKAASAGA
jgi:large subunit ribosomal protein L28